MFVAKLQMVFPLKSFISNRSHDIHILLFYKLTDNTRTHALYSSYISFSSSTLSEFYLIPHRYSILGNDYLRGWPEVLVNGFKDAGIVEALQQRCEEEIED